MPTRTKDTPDAMVWREHGESFYLCSHCVEKGNGTPKGGRDSAYRSVIAHLWRSHALRKVWIVEQVPNLEQVKQLGFDLLIQHNRSF